MSEYQMPDKTAEQYIDEYGEQLGFDTDYSCED